MRGVKLSVGQKVYVVGIDFRGKSTDVTEFEIAAVGRLYFTINDHWKSKFSIETMLEKKDFGYSDRAYLSLQEIQDEKEIQQTESYIQKVFKYPGSGLSLDNLRRIKSIINETNDTNS